MADAGAATLTLESDDGSKDCEPSAAGIDAVFAQPPSGDWCLTLERGEDDFMEVESADGKLDAACEEANVYQRAMSSVGADAARAMLVSFLEGGAGWRDMALWKRPEEKAPRSEAKTAVSIFGGAFAVLFFGIAMVGSGPYMVALFALAFPGVIAVAALTKQLEAKRTAGWTKGSARIVRSEIGRMEYEFPVGLHKFRGSRPNLSEIIGPDQWKELVARYRVGATSPVYYNPADPGESVLDRDLPGFFTAIWIFVGALTALILAGCWWFLWR